MASPSSSPHSPHPFSPSLGPITHGTASVTITGLKSNEVRLLTAAFRARNPMLIFYNVQLANVTDSECVLTLDESISHEFSQHVLQFTFWYALALLYSGSDLNCFNEDKETLVTMDGCVVETNVEFDDDMILDENSVCYTIEARIPISRSAVPKMIGLCGTTIRSIMTDLSTSTTPVRIQIENSHPRSTKMPVLVVYVSGSRSEHELRSVAFAAIEACLITVHT
jgi:hypothetical protein